MCIRDSPNAEVELIDVTTRALLNIGFTGFTVNINDRRILRGMLRRQMVNPQVRTAEQIKASPFEEVYPQTEGLTSNCLLYTSRCV